MKWNDKPYYSLDYYLKEYFGYKVYKIALDGGFSCPNRDGTIGSGGCIFCSCGGSGDFAAKALDIHEQIEIGKSFFKGKQIGQHFIAYFQAYTNTYDCCERLESLYSSALSHPDVVGLSIATRPDCLSEDILDLIARLQKKKPIWIELGLQSIHQKTADLIRRGYDLDCFEKALANLNKRRIPVVVHTIFGLPGETKEDMLETIRYLSYKEISGIKLQLLHILKETDLADMYLHQPFHVLTLSEYTDLVIQSIELLPPTIVIHRITGDGPKSLLIEPLWSSNKKMVLNHIHHEFKERHTYQGRCFNPTKIKEGETNDNKSFDFI